MSGYPGARAAPLRADDPDRLGAYELVGRLGQGGMGTVYLATDRNGRPVAVKVVRPDLAADSEFRQRFRSEVDRARQVPPFCTAEVLDAGPEHESPYLVVEYVDGPSLAEVVAERGPLTAANLHALAVGVATALTAIHGAGVVHRDLKPRNVLLAPGSPKVIDFGIAQAMEATSQLTHTNQMLGTVAYMAPERFDADARMPLGPAADVFAWGAVITYAGTGRTPFHADSAPATAARILTQPPDLAGLPPQLRSLVEQALAKDPRDRPTARELLDLLLGSGPQGSTANAAFEGRPELRDAARNARAASAGEPRRARPGGSFAAATGTPGAGAGVTGAGARSHRRPSRAKAVAAAAVAVVLTVGGVLALLDRQPGPRSAAGIGAPAASGSASAPSNGAAGAGAVVFKDDLARANLWTEEEAKEGSCTFRDTRYVVQLKLEGLFSCDSGPSQRVAGDQHVEVDVTRGGDGACASLLLLNTGKSFYEVQFCRTFAEIYRHQFDEARPVSTFSLAEPLLDGQPTRASVTITGTNVEVRVNGRPVGSTVLVADAVREGGEVTVGVFGEKDGGAPPYEASFEDIEVRSVA